MYTKHDWCVYWYVRMCMDVSMHAHVRVIYVKKEKENRAKCIVRLIVSCVSPPMPRIKNEHVHSFPCIALLNGVQFQNSAYAFSCYIYQIWRSVKIYSNAIVLHIKLQFIYFIYFFFCWGNGWSGLVNHITIIESDQTPT